MTAQKKVIVRRYLGDSLAGYLPGSGFLSGETLSLLDLAGRVVALSLADVKFVAYVRQFSHSEAADLDQSLRRTFLARPRTGGLWVRVTFLTGDTLEGVTTAGVAMLDEILDVRGLQLVPPDTRANTQRIYVPRTSMQQVDLLGVVSAQARRQTAAQTRRAEEQKELFATPDTSFST